MKLLVVLSLALSAIAAAIVAPRQPTSPSHIVALGIDNSDIPLYSDADPVPTVTTSESTATTEDNYQNARDKIPLVTEHVTSTTSRPGDPEPIVILPFYFQVIENCLPDNTIQARGVYKNMDYVWAYTLAKGNTVQVDHGIGGYPWAFLIGPFDYKNSNLHFSYDNGDDFHCDWNDSESWKRCGECRTGLWSAPKLDCNGGGEKTRKKIMNCSFIMGWRSKLTGHPITPPEGAA
ncbi:hypothetical protein J4E90_001752 [Alternaria incomplexa]|uniref:uncharacterized protein n=1 Tax=Alternaria incomplexa TaxID=1187928 RepID=UPI0022201C6B|nr:uncharacterized protein J4E90_001752 [Alternaria incomplexa]KAI4919615.1 hypothetical protein J4E90_001752 [Alternaria incomplexa]